MNKSRLKCILVVSSAVLWVFAACRRYHAVHELLAGSLIATALDRPASLAVGMTQTVWVAPSGRRVLQRRSMWTRVFQPT